MPKKLQRIIKTQAILLGTQQRLKHFNRSLTFRSLIDFLGSLFYGSPGILGDLPEEIDKQINFSIEKIEHAKYAKHAHAEHAEHALLVAKVRLEI